MPLPFGDVLLSVARCATADYIASPERQDEGSRFVQSGGLEGIRRDLSHKVGWMEHPDTYHAAVQRAASSAVALSAVVRWATRKRYIVPRDLTAEQTLEWQNRLLQESWESAWILKLAQNLDEALQRAIELDPRLPARTVDAELEAELMEARRRAAESTESRWGVLSDPAAAGVLAPSLRRWVRTLHRVRRWERRQVQGRSQGPVAAPARHPGRHGVEVLGGEYVGYLERLLQTMIADHDISQRYGFRGAELPSPLPNVLRSVKPGGHGLWAFSRTLRVLAQAFERAGDGKTALLAEVLADEVLGAAIQTRSEGAGELAAILLAHIERLPPPSQTWERHKRRAEEGAT